MISYASSDSFDRRRRTQQRKMKFEQQNPKKRAEKEYQRHTQTEYSEKMNMKQLNNNEIIYLLFSFFFYVIEALFLVVVFSVYSK